MPLYENGKEVLGNLADYPEQRPRFASSVSCLSQKVKVDLDTSASPKTIIDTSVYKVKPFYFRIVIAVKILLASGSLSLNLAVALCMSEVNIKAEGLEPPIFCSQSRRNSHYPTPCFYSNTQDSNLDFSSPERFPIKLHYYRLNQVCTNFDRQMCTSIYLHPRRVLPSLSPPWQGGGSACLPSWVFLHSDVFS